MKSLNPHVKALNDINKNQNSQALIVQGYAQSVLEQPQIDFSGESSLIPYQTEINNGLMTAQTHANTYLNTIENDIIKNIGNIESFYAANKAIPTVLKPGSTKNDWLKTLNSIRELADNYEKQAGDTATTLSDLNKALTSDAAAFSKVVSDMNAAVSGDNGMLSTISSSLHSIDNEIHGEIAGIVVSSLAIIGGAVLIGIGALTDIVSAGATTPVIMGGVAILVAGVSGEAAAGSALHKLLGEKSALIAERAKLNVEVKQGLLMSSGYSSLESKVHDAANASLSMKNAWSSLNSDLDELISNLTRGITDTGIVQEIFLNAAQTEISTGLNDCQTIKAQMAGVKITKAQSGQSLSQLVTQMSLQAA